MKPGLMGFEVPLQQSHFRQGRMAYSTADLLSYSSSCFSSFSFCSPLQLAVSPLHLLFFSPLRWAVSPLLLVDWLGPLIPQFAYSTEFRLVPKVVNHHHLSQHPKQRGPILSAFSLD